MFATMRRGTLLWSLFLRFAPLCCWLRSDHKKVREDKASIPASWSYAVFGFIFSGVWTLFKITFNAQTKNGEHSASSNRIKTWPFTCYSSLRKSRFTYQSLRLSTCDTGLWPVPILFCPSAILCAWYHRFASSAFLKMALQDRYVRTFFYEHKNIYDLISLCLFQNEQNTFHLYAVWMRTQRELVLWFMTTCHATCPNKTNSKGGKTPKQPV